MTHLTPSPDPRIADTPPRDVLLNSHPPVPDAAVPPETDGDPALARGGARETVAAYRAPHDPSLMMVARIIAFSLAALEFARPVDARRSGDPADPAPARQRQRVEPSAERAERALAEAPCAAAEPPKPIDEAAILADVAAAQARAAAARASLQDPRAPAGAATGTNPAADICPDNHARAAEPQHLGRRHGRRRRRIRRRGRDLPPAERRTQRCARRSSAPPPTTCSVAPRCRRHSRATSPA